MRKATDDLPPNVIPLNRRLLLGSLIGAAGVPSAAPAAVPVARPTVLGVALLAAIAELRVAWQQHDGSDLPGVSPSARRIAALDRRIDALRDRIVLRPAVELPAVVDRAIVCQYVAEAGEAGPEARSLTAAVLGLAGIAPEACCL